MCLKNQLNRLHYGEWNPLLWLLWPLEAAYALGVKIRMAAYHRGVLKAELPADVPVISVGNLTTGGTGKTPVVMEIARGLVKAGKSVVILSRGYGASEPVAYHRAMDPKYGDEAYLMQEQVPEAAVIVGRNRVETLKRAVKDYRPDFVLLDDGFQYVRLKRTVNILLIDGEKLFGNEHLLPVGPLREPISAIGRADMIFVTKHVSPEVMARIQNWVQAATGTEIPVLPAGFQLNGFQRLTLLQEQVPLEKLRGKHAVVVSAIAQPERFEADLRAVGISIAKHFKMDDHHNYTASDVQKIAEALAKQPAETIVVMTEKDRVKIQSLLSDELKARSYALKTGPTLDGQWFYHEFLTQMPALSKAGKPPLSSSHGSST